MFRPDHTETKWKSNPNPDHKEVQQTEYGWKNKDVTFSTSLLHGRGWCSTPQLPDRQHTI